MATPEQHPVVTIDPFPRSQISAMAMVLGDYARSADVDLVFPSAGQGVCIFNPELVSWKSYQGNHSIAIPLITLPNLENFAREKGRNPDGFASTLIRGAFDADVPAEPKYSQGYINEPREPFAYRDSVDRTTRGILADQAPRLLDDLQSEEFSILGIGKKSIELFATACDELYVDDPEMTIATV